MSQNTAEKRDQRQLEQTRQGQVLSPPVDILENETELLIVADMPGATPDKIKLHLEPPEFQVEAGFGSEQEPATYVRRFRVEERIAAEQVSAEYKNGVLTVRLPKSSAAKPRRIEVRAG
jgi:HSP20 family molecular chaperone IbpA